MTVRQEIEMLNRQAAAIRHIREEMEEELEAIERAAIEREVIERENRLRESYEEEGIA